MAAVFRNQEELQEKHFRKQLAATMRSIQWSYAIFWAVSTKQQHEGILGWSEGYYNGDIKTRKTTQSMELKADQMGLQRSEQLRDLFFSLPAGDSNQQTKRPSASLSPEDLTNSEWYYLVCMSFTFKPGEGFPGKVLTSNQPIWLSSVQIADSKIFSRSLLAKSASIKTIVCFPFMGGVLELGTTEQVLEDLALIQHVTTHFWELTTAVCSEESIPCSPEAEKDKDNLCPITNHKTDTNAMVLEDHNVMIDFQNPLESDSAVFPLTPHSYASKEEAELIENIVELHENVCEEINVGSPVDSWNDCPNQLTDVSLGMDGLNSTSQAHTHLMDDEFLHGLYNSLNTSDHLALPFSGPHMVLSSPKGERVKNNEVDYLQEGNFTNLIPLDLDPDKFQFARTFNGDKAHYAGTLFAILSNSKKTSSISYFRNTSHESSFKMWKGSSCAPKLPTNMSQKMLKKILLDSVSMHGDKSLKSQEDNAVKNKNCKSEVDDVGASHVLSERRRREKLNEKFLILRSLVPSISKVDKASILSDTIEYLKELERRVDELESYRDQVELEARDRRKSLDITERTSDNYGSNEIIDGRRLPTSKRKACDIEELEAENPRFLTKDGVTDINVTKGGNEVLIEVCSPWRDSLLLKIVEVMSNHDLDAHSVQSSTIDGILMLTLSAKSRSSPAASLGMIKKALQKVVGRY